MDPPPHHQYRYPRPSQAPPPPPPQQQQQQQLKNYSSNRHHRYSSHDIDSMQQYLFQLNNNSLYYPGDGMSTLSNLYHEQPQEEYLSTSFRSSGSHMPMFSDNEDIFATTGNTSVINEYEQTSFQLEDYSNDPLFIKQDCNDIVSTSGGNSLHQRNSGGFANVSLDFTQQLPNSQQRAQYQQQHQRSHLYSQNRRARGNSRAPPPLRPPPSNPPPLAPQMSGHPPNQPPPPPPQSHAVAPSLHPHGSNHRQAMIFKEPIHFDVPEYMARVNSEYSGMNESNAADTSHSLHHQQLFDDFDRQFDELDQQNQSGSLMSPIGGNEQQYITPRHSYDLSLSSACSVGVFPPQPQFAPSSGHNSMLQESPILQSPMNFPSQNWLAHSLANYHHQRNSSLFSHHRHSSLLSNGNYSHSSIMSQPVGPPSLQHKQHQHQPQHQVPTAKKEKRNSQNNQNQNQNQNQYHFINYEAATIGLGLGLQLLSNSSSKHLSSSKAQTPSRGQPAVKGPFIVNTPTSLQKQQELQEKVENPRHSGVPQVAEQSTPLESRNPVINKAIDKVESKTSSLDTQAFEDMLSSLIRVPLIKREHSPMEEEITADDFFKALELDDQDFFAIETSSSSNLTSNSSTLTLAQQQQQSSQTPPLLSIHQLHQQNQTATQLQFIPLPPSMPSLSLQPSTTPTHHKSQYTFMTKLQLDGFTPPGSNKMLRTKKSMPILSSSTSVSGSINKKSLKKSQSYSKLLNKRHSSTSVSPSTSAGPISELSAPPGTAGSMNQQHLTNKGSFSLNECSSSFSVRSSNIILENYHGNSHTSDNDSLASTLAQPPLHHNRKSSLSSVGSSGTEYPFVMTGPPLPKESTHKPSPINTPPKHLKNMESGIFSFQVQLNK